MMEKRFFFDNHEDKIPETCRAMVDKNLCERDSLILFWQTTKMMFATYVIAILKIYQLLVGDLGCPYGFPVEIHF